MTDILQYKDYYASVHFNSEDEVFFGKILSIDDLVNFEGESVKALKKSFREAVEDYLQTCKELGKEPNKTYKGTFVFKLWPPNYDAVGVGTPIAEVKGTTAATRIIVD